MEEVECSVGEIMKMKNLTLRNGRIFLDGEEVEFLRSYKIVSSAEERGFAELTMVIPVRTDAESEVELTWNTQKKS